LLFWSADHHYELTTYLCVQNISPLLPALSKVDLAHSSTSILLYHLFLGLPSCLLPQGSTTTIISSNLSLMHVTWPSHFPLPSNIPTVYVEKCKLRSSSLCNFVYPRTMLSFSLQRRSHPPPPTLRQNNKAILIPKNHLLTSI
jgi:hypothetical protein